MLPTNNMFILNIGSLWLSSSHLSSLAIFIQLPKTPTQLMSTRPYQLSNIPITIWAVAHAKALWTGLTKFKIFSTFRAWVFQKKNSVPDSPNPSVIESETEHGHNTSTITTKKIHLYHWCSGLSCIPPPHGTSFLWNSEAYFAIILWKRFWYKLVLTTSHDEYAVKKTTGSLLLSN